MGHDSNTVIDASRKTADCFDSANTEIDFLLYNVRGLDKAADAEMIPDDSEDDAGDELLPIRALTYPLSPAERRKQARVLVGAENPVGGGFRPDYASR